MARGTRSTNLRGSIDDSPSKDARPYLTRSLARSLGAPPKQADEETEPPTLSQEARLTAHEEEVYYQGLHLKADNAKLHQAQAKAEGEDPSWTLSQESSSFHRTSSMSSVISRGDDGDDDDTDEFKVPSSGNRAVAYQESRKGTSPPGSTAGGTTDAGDYDSEHENDDDDYDEESDNGGQADAEKPTTKRDRQSSFPEDKLDAKKLREIGRAFRETPTWENPHELFDALKDEYELDRVDLQKAREFAKDHKDEMKNPKSWKDSELLDVARAEWSMLLDDRF